jgi:hypothetical protein
MTLMKSKFEQFVFFRIIRFRFSFNKLVENI